MCIIKLVCAEICFHSRMKMSDSKDALVLVTGATGFVAHHIIQLLQQEGYRVRGTVRNLKNENKLKSLKSLCPDAKYPLEFAEADLTKENGWNDALKGCTYCIHVASPFPNAPPKKEEDVIIPAVEGTKRVLRACAYTDTVKRVVLTSSIAAVHGETSNIENREYTEEDWTDVSSSYADAYSKSKTLAELAAWDFVRALPPERKLELSVVNPGIIFGPCISGLLCTSIEIVKRLMDCSAPMLASIHFTVCDVRDVALAHLRAMTLPEAAGNRHLVRSEHLWMHDIARILKEEFSRYGYFVPSIIAPYIGVYLFSFIDNSSNLVLPRYGKSYLYSNTRMTEVLKINPRCARQTVLDTAYSLIECGMLKKTRKYKAKK